MLGTIAPPNKILLILAKMICRATVSPLVLKKLTASIRTTSKISYIGGIFWYIRVYYRDNGKENGNYYTIQRLIRTTSKISKPYTEQVYTCNTKTTVQRNFGNIDRTLAAVSTMGAGVPPLKD